MIAARILLVSVALLLGIILVPLGLLYALGYWLALDAHMGRQSLGRAYFGKALFELARGIDQLGNGVCFLLFNATLIVDAYPAPFGNIDETISSVLGRNKRLNNLTTAGLALAWLLEAIDPGHLDDSIGE
jgi:8-oxo-dGTP diphosphatase